MKTVYLRELTMQFKVVYNVVSDKFYFDHNIVLLEISVCGLKKIGILVQQCKLEFYHRDINCLKYYFWQLLFRSKNSLIKSKISVRFVISLNFSHLENFADSRLKILISMVSSVHINFFHKEVFIEFFLAQRMVQAKKKLKF